MGDLEICLMRARRYRLVQALFIWGLLVWPVVSYILEVNGRAGVLIWIWIKIRINEKCTKLHLNNNEKYSHSRCLKVITPSKSLTKMRLICGDVTARSESTGGQIQTC